MESEANGREANGAHSVTPGPRSGASRRRMLRARAAQQMARRAPSAPTCSSSKPNTSSSARRASALSSRSTRAPKGPSNQPAAALSQRCFQLPFLHEITSEDRMLQVKYAAKCQTDQPLSACGRCAHLPIITFGSSSRRECPARVVAVDPGEAAPVIAELERSGASLAAILLTHHHPDHIGGVSELLARGPVPVVGPDDERIPQRTRTVGDGDRCELPDLGLGFDILQVPGHTLTPYCLLGARRAVLRGYPVQRGVRPTCSRVRLGK